MSSIVILVIIIYFPIYGNTFKPYTGLISPLKFFSALGLIMLIIKFNNYFKTPKQSIDIKKEYFFHPILLTAFIITYILTRLYFILHSPINVSDDWQAITSGKSIIENGYFPSITTNDSQYGYIRGAYVSILVAIFFKLFGYSIYVAKAVPAFIGLLNSILFYNICSKIFQNRWVKVLSLIIYIVCPLIIFNDWFIRMYVFYEFFALLSILFLFRINLFIETKQNKKILTYIILIVLINIFCWFLSFDPGKYLILILNIFGLFAILFLNRKELYKFDIIKKITCNKFLRITDMFILVTIIMSGFMIRYFPVIQDRIFFLLNGKLDNSLHLSFYKIFFEENIILTLLFITSSLFIVKLKNNSSKLITIIGISLFLLHLISSDDLQVSRGLLYFIPIYIIIALISLENIIEWIGSKLFSILLIMIIVLNILLSFPLNYIESFPSLENELHYQDDLGLYSFIKTDLKNYTILQSTYENMPDLFFDTYTEFNIILNSHSTTDIPYFYFDSENNLYRQISTKTPVVTNADIFENKFNILLKNKVAIVILPHVRELFIDNKTFEVIRQKLPNLRKFVGYEIYYN